MHAEFTRPYIEFSFGFQELPAVVPIPLPHFSWVREEKLYLRGFPHYLNNFIWFERAHGRGKSLYRLPVSQWSQQEWASLPSFPFFPIYLFFPLFLCTIIFLFVCVHAYVCLQSMCVHIYVGVKGPFFFSSFIVFPLRSSVSCTVFTRDKPGGLTRFQLKHGLSPNSCQFHPPQAVFQALEEMTRGGRNHPSLPHVWKEPGCVQ